jgi:hypothetical protein
MSVSGADGALHLSLLKNEIGPVIGSRVKIGMRIFINRVGRWCSWCDLASESILAGHAAIAKRNDPSPPKSACPFGGPRVHAARRS